MNDQYIYITYFAKVIKMLDVMTCAILSIATIFCMAIMAIGSVSRLRKLDSLIRLKKAPKIVLPKTDLTSSNAKPFWAHRAFQMRRCSQVTVDMTYPPSDMKNSRKNSTISIGKETTV